MNLTRQAQFLPQTFEKDKNTCEVVWTAGAKVLRQGWGEPFYEDLEISDQAVNLSRLNSGAPVLNNHQSKDLSSQIGVVERAWIQGNEGKALVRLSKRKEVQPLIEDIQQGILRNISVGYSIDQSKEIKQEGQEIRTLRVTEWTPYEISFVPIPADPKAQTRARKDTMPKPQDSQTTASPSEVYALCRQHAMDENFTANLLKEPVTLDHARSQILEKLAASSVKTRIEVTVDEEETKRSFLEQALMHRIAPSSTPAESIRPYLGTSLIDIARHYVGGTSKQETASRAFHSTSDFPLLLANVAKTKLAKSFEELIKHQVFWPLVRERSVTDFKEVRRVRAGETPSFVPKREGQEYQYSTFGEEAESFRIHTYGRAFSISREALINDDLGVFDGIGDWGASAARLLAKLFWSVFNDNQVMSDGTLLFHAKHNNLSEKSKISLDSLSKARLAMRRQQGVDKREGDYLAIVPRYLIVPPELEVETAKILTPITATESGNVNPLAGAYKILVGDGLIDPKSWYLSADRSQGIDLIEMAFLEGRKTPTVEWKQDFDRDAIAVKARIDVGCRAVDYRGMHKVQGA